VGASDTKGGTTGVCIYEPGFPVSSVTNSTTFVPVHTYLGYVPTVSAIIQLIPYCTNSPSVVNARDENLGSI
jgi:hypothetical protein